LVREALEEYGVQCELILITNGETAIEFIQKVEADETPCPKLVILDLNLPRKPGRDVLKRIRASSKCEQIPVIVLTSSDARKDRDDAASLGASRYIRKPSRLSEFIELGSVFKEIIGGSSN
jgi:two-component system, chemotaxis family, response regulator Rcp1